MLSSDILKKIRQIEIHTKRLLSTTLIGDHNSARKGAGFDFDQMREYQQGDDVRFIDWKSSSRFDKLMVKECIEERTRTIMLAVDVSASTFFSSTDELKTEMMQRVAAVLALVADYGKDHVGLVLFSDEIERVIPAGAGQKQVRSIMQALFSHVPRGRGTSIKNLMAHLRKMNVRNTMVFIISDFIDTDYESNLYYSKAFGEVIAVRCTDMNEHMLPSVGLLPLSDLETGEYGVIDTRSSAHKALKNILEHRLFDQKNMFKKYGIELLDLSPSRPFIGDIMRFFRQRMY